MSEPTIDEMLEWVDMQHDRLPIPRAIRAILEQHRDIEKTELEYVTHFELTAIRAFVGRVEKRLPSYSSGRGADEWLKNYHRAVKDELEAMESDR